jgi:hypothetical protein
MSGKYNRLHPQRGASNYPARLAARGLMKAPAMEPLEKLRERQQRRYDQTASPWADGWVPDDPAHVANLRGAYGIL